MDWWSIEVTDAAHPAAAWWESWGEQLVEAAVTHGAVEWETHYLAWGLVLELGFDDETRWERFRALPLVTAALDAVPDAVGGLLIYRGRGGTSGAGWPRRPRPTAGAGAAELPEPEPAEPLDLTAVTADVGWDGSGGGQLQVS